jgi:hypothetical protein
VEGTPSELKELVARDYGKAPSMDSVFMTFTGKSLDDDVDDDNEDDD